MMNLSTWYDLYYASTEFNPATKLTELPPTVAALNEHAKRAYYRVQLWRDNEMDPLEWGWKKKDKILVPVMTKEAAAPPELLQMVITILFFLIL